VNAIGSRCFSTPLMRGFLMATMNNPQQPWRLWAFVIGFNLVAFLGYAWARSQGIGLR